MPSEFGGKFETKVSKWERSILKLGSLVSSVYTGMSGIHRGKVKIKTETKGRHDAIEHHLTENATVVGWLILSEDTYLENV